MPETERFELVTETAHALALLPGSHAAINRIYNRDRGRYHAAALSCPEHRNPALYVGRAEHQIIGLKVLGIFASGSETDIAVILRAAMRRAFDALVSIPEGSEVCIDEYAYKYIPESDDNDTAYAKVVVLMAICATRHLIVQPTDIVQSVLGHAESRRYLAANRRRRSRNDEAVREMRSLLGVTGANGITGLYSGTTDSVRAGMEQTLKLLNAEGLDSGEYTSGVLLSPVDAEVIADTGSPDRAADKAVLILLARAIKMDREFCLSMYRDSNEDELLSAKHEADRARQESESARSRISALESEIVNLRRELESAQKQLKSHNGDSTELASLRDAIYAMSQTQDEQFSQHDELREIPDGIVVIGGHPQWAKLIREACGVRVWATGTTCPASVIQNATELWIQSAYMSHSEFYASINQARRYEVPVKYFPGTGVSTCVNALRSAQ